MARSTTDKAKAVVAIQFQGVEEEIAKLKKQMGSLGKAIPTAAKGGFDKIDKQVQRLKDELKGADSEETFKNLQVSMGAVADEAEKIGKIISQSQGKRGQILNVGETNRATNALRKYKDQMRQVNSATQRNSLASQNMLRVIQDSPFGMLGMANNIQMLGEDISRGLQKGVSAADTLKGALKNLIMGPMAIAAVIAIGTLIIQKWDKIVEAGNALRDTLDGLTESQKELNKVVREYASMEHFDKFAESLNVEELGQARDVLLAERDALVATNEAVRNMDVDAIMNRTKALGMLGTVMGVVSGTGASMSAGMSAMNPDGTLAKQMNDLNERILKLDAELIAKRAAEAERVRFGLESDEQKEADKKLKKEQDDWQKRQIALIKAKEDQAEMARKFAEDDLKLAEEQAAEQEKILKEAQAKELKMIAEHNKNVRQWIRNQSVNLRSGDKAASAIGVGAMGAAAADLSRGEKMARVEESAFWEKARIDEMVAVRRDAQEELQDMMSRESGAELEALKTQHQKLEDEITAYEAKRVEITVSAEEKILMMKKQARQEDLQHMSSIASSTGQMFGSMATLMATEGEKGLQQHKGLMKAAATAEAIAASISIFRGMVRSNPLSVAAAFAASGAVLMSLMAKIRQIDNPNGASAGGAAVTGGRFTSLNGNVAAGRANAYNQGQDRLAQSGAAQSAMDGKKQGEAIINALGDQKVVIDQATIAQVSRMGEKTNQRRVQTSS